MPVKIRERLFPEGLRARDIVPLGALAFFSVCCVYAIYVHATAGVLPYDDSYISYRYAGNVFKGDGLVYNRGEHVFGSSTPLYVAWLIGLKMVAPSAEIPTLAVRTNIIFFLATAFGFLFLFRRALGWTAAALVAAGLFPVRFAMLAISMGGNEAFLFCALVAWSFYFLLTEKYVPSGMLAGLSIVTRPEGVFCALLVGLVWLICDRKKAVAFVVAVVAPGLVWTVFAFAYYGTPIYHSIIAKSRPLYPFPPGFALRYTMERLAFWSGGYAAGFFDVAVVLVAAVAGFVFRRRAQPTTWFVIPSFVGLIVVFYAVSNPFVFDWYFPVIFVGWFPLVMVGLGYLATELADAARHRYGFKDRLAVTQFLCAALPLLLLGGSACYTWEERDTELPSGYFARHHAQFRTQTYRETAEFLNRVAGASDRVASPEVGALGFYLERHVYDACGLVTPEAIPYLPPPHGKRVGPNIGSISAEFAEAVNADWIVTMEVFAIESLAESPWFKQNYKLAKLFPLEFETFASRHIMVYRHE